MSLLLPYAQWMMMSCSCKKTYFAKRPTLQKDRLCEKTDFAKRPTLQKDRLCKKTDFAKRSTLQKYRLCKKSDFAKSPTMQSAVTGVLAILFKKVARVGQRTRDLSISIYFLIGEPRRLPFCYLFKTTTLLLRWIRSHDPNVRQR
jgi:hypothetical protein